MKSERQRRERSIFGWVTLGLMAVAAICWTGCSEKESSQKGETDQAESPGGSQPISGPDLPESEGTDQPDAGAILERMVEAYRTADSYADQGYMEISGSINGQPINDWGRYRMTFERPDKVRMEVFQGVAMSNGEHFWASVMDSPDLLKRPAPAKLSPASLLSDALLAKAMARGPTQLFSWIPIQATLLFASNPLQTLLLHAVEAPRLLEPDMCGKHACYRVAFRRPDGEYVFWIDQESHILRRFEVPTDELARMSGQPQGGNLSFAIELEDAQFNTKIDPIAFTFQPPPEANFVETLRPPGASLLGKPVPAFSFVDLEQNPIDPKSLAGKVVVFDIWATWCGPCRQSLPMLDEYYQQFKDNPDVAFLAVSVDEADVDDDALRSTFDELKVTVPIVRDLKQSALKDFEATLIPAMVVLDATGVVQVFEIGLVQGLPMVIERLLAGENLYQRKLDQIEQTQARFKQWLALQEEQDLYAGPLTFDQMPVQADIAPKSEPKSFQRTELWQCQKLTSPGNILAIGPDPGPARLLVLDVGRTIAEIELDGTVVATHDLPVLPNQPVDFLRTALGADGRRLLLGSANNSQQMHLLDDGFELLWSYPEETEENPHQGIGDVQFADLDGNGEPEICVGYWGEVGVQGVSLEGKRVWANRSLADALRLVVSDPDDDGRRHLLSVNQKGSLVTINGQGQRVDELFLPELAVYWITAADLDQDGRQEICGFTPTPAGHFMAMGLTLEGKLLWTYPLPPGTHQWPIEPVTTCQLAPDGPRHWFLAAADGSVHVLAPDGKLVDQFNYGAALTGLASTQINGKPALVVATTESVDAWQITP